MTSDRVSELLHLTHTISRLMRPKDTFGDVTRAEFFIMNVLFDAKKDENFKGITVTKIANIMHASTAATSKLLRIAEEKGYIARTLDDNDRRVVYICLTQKGEDLTESARNNANERIHYLLEKLGEADTENLMRILYNVIEIIQE